MSREQRCLSMDVCSCCKRAQTASNHQHAARRTTSAPAARRQDAILRRELCVLLPGETIASPSSFCGMETTKRCLTDDIVWMKKRNLEQIHGPKNRSISENVKEIRDMM